VPDKRSHRGPNPRDEELFSEKMLPALRTAVGDYSMLLGMGYPENASLKLVGDQLNLQKRQRMAVARSSCAAVQVVHRQERLIPLESVRDQMLQIDGFNLLITIESALSGGFIIVGQDTAYRDIASLHGTFKTVEETAPAIELIGTHLEKIGSVKWLLDRPVSNSARVKQLILHAAEQHGWNWQVELVQDPDAVLKQTSDPVVTADSVILDHCEKWVNLASEIIHAGVPDARIVNLSQTD